MTDKYLPTAYQQVYYVYFHTDPDTQEVMYIGFGTGERAWIGRCNNRNNSEHVEWLASQQAKLRTPDEYVSIEFKSFDKNEALAKERELIEDLAPKFNYTGKWEWCMVLNEEQLKSARYLRDETGLSYKAIATEIGVSTMTIYRALNGQTKGYNE